MTQAAKIQSDFIDFLTYIEELPHLDKILKEIETDENINDEEYYLLANMILQAELQIKRNNLSKY